MALIALSLAEQCGISVPGELKMTGFDGIAEVQHRRPMIITVYQGNYAKGVTAARLVTGERHEHDICQPAWLIYGDILVL